MDDIKNVVRIEKTRVIKDYSVGIYARVTKTTVSVYMPGSVQTAKSSSTALPIRYRDLHVLRQHTGHGLWRISLLM